MTVIQLVTELLNTGKYYNEVLIELDDGKIFEVNGITIDSKENIVFLED